MYRIEDVKRAEKGIEWIEDGIKCDVDYLNEMILAMQEDMKKGRIDEIESSALKIIETIHELRIEKRILDRFENCVVKVEE